MLRIYGCLTENHDLRLVLVAAAICLLSCFTAFTMLDCARKVHGKAQGLWVAIAATVTGVGIWATHFVAMLGFDAHMPMAYDPWITAASALFAMLFSGIGYKFIISDNRNFLGGGVVGLAIILMHYSGMLGIRFQADISWDATLVAASIILGIACPACAFGFRQTSNPRTGKWGGIALLLIGICALHFIGMSAVTLTPNPTLIVPTQMFSSTWLSVAITILTVLVLSLGLIASIVDKYILELQAAKAAVDESSEQLKQTLHAAHNANSAKSQFLAVMSHELRTPLNAIIGFSDLIKNQTFGPNSTDKYTEYAQHISDSGAHLLALINDILDLSKIDAERIDLQNEVIELEEIVEDCLVQVRQKAATQQVTLTTELLPPLPALWADRRRMHQVLLNLLTNAVKFTPPGGEVNIWARGSGKHLIVEVRDNGIGIKPEDIPVVLERFGQIDSQLSRKHEGTGLGLPICKLLMERHDGKLELDSVLGQGTVVRLTFPTERLRDSPSQAQQPSLERSSA